MAPASRNPGSASSSSRAPTSTFSAPASPGIYGRQTMIEIHEELAGRASELGDRYRLLPVEPRGPAHRLAPGARIRRGDRERGRTHPHQRGPPRRAPGGQAALRRGAPLRPVEARAVPAGELPRRHRARVDRGARRPGLRARARVAGDGAGGRARCTVMASRRGRVPSRRSRRSPAIAGAAGSPESRRSFAASAGASTRSTGASSHS